MVKILEIKPCEDNRFNHFCYCWTQRSLSDWDYDGVKDILDICGDTENGAIVDDQGCVIEAENTDAINDSTPESIPGFEVSVLLSSIVCALITLRRRV